MYMVIDKPLMDYLGAIGVSTKVTRGAGVKQIKDIRNALAELVREIKRKKSEESEEVWDLIKRDSSLRDFFSRIRFFKEEFAKTNTRLIYVMYNEGPTKPYRPIERSLVIYKEPKKPTQILSLFFRWYSPRDPYYDDQRRGKVFLCTCSVPLPYLFLFNINKNYYNALYVGKLYNADTTFLN